MARLGKRRADDALQADGCFDQPSIKRHHAQGEQHAPVVSPAAEQVPQSQQQPGAAAAAAQPQPVPVPEQHTGCLPPAVAPPAVTPGAVLSLLGPDVTAVASPAVAAPVQCTDLVLYQPPPQQPVFGAFSGSAEQPEPQQLLQQHQQAAQLQQQQQHSLLQQLKQHRDLDTANNDNAALKSVWRNLTAAQKRSLAGMWDVIKSEELLPRLVPQSGLLALPSTDSSSSSSNGHLQQQQQRWQQEPACIVEVHDDADDNEPGSSKQQQQQGAAANGFTHLPNGFTLPGTAADIPSAAAAGTGVAEAPAGDVEMQLDHQPSVGAPLAPSRQPSVEDMEM